MKTNKHNLESFKNSVELIKKMIPAIKEQQNISNLINDMFEEDLKKNHKKTLDKLDEFKKSKNINGIIDIINDLNDKKTNGSKSNNNK